MAGANTYKQSYAATFVAPSCTFPNNGAKAVAVLTGDIPGLTPGATLAPNFLYTVNNPMDSMNGFYSMGKTQCFTETLGSGDINDPTCSGTASIMGCLQNSGVCLDALTKGLLSPLTPMMSTHSESIFD